MSEEFDKFAKELDGLIKDGEMLYIAMQYSCAGASCQARDRWHRRG
jgi:hypothetical protein